MLLVYLYTHNHFKYILAKVCLLGMLIIHYHLPLLTLLFKKRINIPMITVTAWNNTLPQFADILIGKPIQFQFQLHPLHNFGKIQNTPRLTELYHAVAIQE